MRRTLAKHLFATSLALLAFGIAESRAEFALNWARGPGFQNNDGYINCNRPDSPTGFGDSGRCAGVVGGFNGYDPDVTPFLQETVTEGGVTYWHLIIGLNGSDSFAQEVFIRQQPGTDCGQGFTAVFL